MTNTKDFTVRFTLNDAIYFVATFIGILVAAKFGQYLFFQWHTSPAVLWPPTGIALAIMWLGGYRYGVPIFLGHFVATITGPSGHLIPAIVTTPLAMILGLAVSVYLLRQFKFDGTFSTVRNVMVFLGCIIVGCMITPSITTLISFVTGNLSTSAFISWSRAWAGYVFSCLILTPLIIAWVTPDPRGMLRHWFESVFVGILLVIGVYTLFWTHLASQFSFLLFALFLLAHFWVSYRFSTRVVTLSIFVTTVVGILGLFVSPNPERALNSQLLATELFFFLVVPIFYAFSALVKERANTIDELHVAMDKIAKESIVKSNFISVLAHELRNPLAPIKTTLEILEHQNLDVQTHQLIESAQYHVHSMRRLLDDLLDITRVTQGKFQLQLEKSHLKSMIERSIVTTQSLFNRAHTFTVQPPCDDSIWLMVDPVRFEQALVNILNNAAKYSNPGGKIVISPIVRNNVVELQIADNGIGIEKEHLEDIFESFWQAKNNMSANAGGIGVGLALTKHIVELHGGSLKAHSEGKGKGSTFTVVMPLPTDFSAAVTRKEKVTAPIPLCKILVVDDNHAAADSLAKLLTLKGHTAETAYSGMDAIEATKTFDPDVILLDIGLPDIDGYDVAKSLRANAFKKRIIALSGYGQAEDKEKALKAGCDHHITKPMAIARLEEYLVTL